MQIARDGDRRGREFPFGDVETALERDARLRREVDVAVEVDALLDVFLVSGRSVVHVTDPVVDAVSESEVPRQREVVVGLRHVLPPQHGVHLPVGVVERVLVKRVDAVDVVDGRYGVVGSGIERIAERGAGVYDAPGQTAAPHELVDALALGGYFVRIERGGDVDAEILDDRRTQPERQIRKPHRIGDEVVGAADREFVDQFDFLDARGVALAQNLHFERLTQREGQRRGLHGAGDAVGVVRKGE